MSVSSDSRIGTELAGYRIEALLARGGMGVVYKATELSLERPVALKLIAPELVSQDRFRERFLRESRLAASLDHPNVVPIYEAGEAEGMLFLAMRYVEGSDLKALIQREGKLAPDRALAICAQIAGALDAAHARGLVHRDVKPGNILLDSLEHAYLGDFGLTKQVAGAGLTETGQLVGTLDYLAPEQIRGEPLDGRADLYALACVLYECVAGEPPFRRGTEAELLWAQIHEPAPELQLPDCPKLDPVVAKALAKAPDSRYETGAELVSAVQAALTPAREGAAAEGVLTIMFTDVESSTALANQWGDAVAREVIEAHKQIVREHVAVRGGREIDSIGDGFMIAFVSTRAAVACAIAIQDALADYGRNHPGRSVRVRIGLNAGEVLEREGHPFGAAVNAAARVAACAGGGTILVAESVQQLAGRLENASFRDRGRFRLKGFDQRWRLYEVVWNRDASTSLGAAPATRRRPLIPLSLIRRGWLLVMLGGLILAGAIAATTHELIAGGNGTLLVAPNSVGVIDPSSNRVVKSIPVGDTPTTVAVGDRYVWVLNANEPSLSRINPDTNEEVRRSSSGPLPSTFAVGDGAVWVASAAHTVTKIDPDSGVPLRTITLRGSPNPLGESPFASWVAAGRNSVWATGSSSVVRVDPSPAKRIVLDTPACCGGVAIGEGGVWVTDQLGVVKIDPSTGSHTRVSLSFFSPYIAVGMHAVWVSDQQRGKVWVIDPARAQVVDSIPVGEHPAGIAVGAGSVWVASGDGTVSRIDPKTRVVTKMITVGGTPDGIAVGHGAVWVSVD